MWQQAALLTGFSLYQPVDQRPAPDSTDVRVWYSSTAIYFGIRAFEPHGTVAATLADRDRISADDNIEIHLDTFDERNRALVFIVNPLGVQADGTKSEAGGFIPGSNVMPGQNDLSADFIWQSRGRLVEGGYEVEVRIPFSSLRYRGAAEQRWGLQIDRRVQHNGYEETWTPAKRASASFIGQAGRLVGLRGMQPRRNRRAQSGAHEYRERHAVLRREPARLAVCVQASQSAGTFGGRSAATSCSTAP